MLTRVVSALREQDGVSDWSVQQVRAIRTQHYTIGARTESRRTVASDQVVVTVMNDHPSAKDGSIARGEARVTLLPTDGDVLADKISQAVFMAGLTDNAPYGLPEPTSYPQVQALDSELQTAPRRAAEAIIDGLLQALAGEEGVRLSSAEVLTSDKAVTLRNSRGASCEEASTDLLLDCVLLASGGGNEMEAHLAVERRRVADLDLGALVRRQARYARDALRAATPRTGTFPVVLSDDALVDLLMASGDSPLVALSSAELKYQQMSTWESGKSIFRQAPSGDSFTMYSNSLLPFGTRSGAFDNEGLPGHRIAVVENGTLLRFWATQRYAEYLRIPATGSFGNMEIAPGNTPLDNLMDDSALFYHVVSFSAMSPDPLTGDFVAEIRLGYEIHGGEARPIRGGSITGNVLDVLAEAQLSSEAIFLGDYLGPRAARFPKVTVSGSA